MTPYNPTVNGIFERIIKTQENTLRRLKNQTFKLALQKSKDSYNLTFKTAIQTLPFIPQ